MRVIKFRIWDSSCKNWLFNPNLYEDNHNAVNLWCYSQSGLRVHGVSSECVAIQQFTGLKDIKGREIYEGDLLKCTKYCLNREIREVYYSNTLGAFYVTNSKKIGNSGYFNFLTVINMNQWGVKIIGNIFENPKLLRKISGKHY